MNKVTLHVGQVIQVFLTIGGDIEGEFTGLTEDELFMKNCIAKGQDGTTILAKLTIPFWLIKRIEFTRCNRDEI